MMAYKSYIDEAKEKIRQAKLRTLEKIGIFVEGEAIVRTPVDTGNLRNSLTHKVNESENSVSIGTNVEYAVYVEKGTSRQQGQPYLTPAAEENMDTIQQIAKEEMKID